MRASTSPLYLAPGGTSRAEHSQLQVPYGFEVFGIAGAEGQVILGSRCGNDGIAGAETVGQRVLLDIHCGSMPNIL